MKRPKKTLVSWSSGKDSAWSLYVLRRDPAVEVVGLFTSVNQHYDRVSMHATRSELLRRQARAAGLPLKTLSLPDPCSSEQYQAIMRDFVAACIAEGVECMAFGDLYLEDVRAYREDALRSAGIESVFPLWGLQTRELAEEMLRAGLGAYVSSVDLAKLPATFAGRLWSQEMIADLPPECDPCGENGEIHTVVVAGPMLAEQIAVTVGEVVERDGFAYADIVPE
jgi:uncharacterized protein (TIGR00290 family)